MTCSSSSNIPLLRSKVINLSFVDQELSNDVFNSTIRPPQRKLGSRLTELTGDQPTSSWSFEVFSKQERASTTKDVPKRFHCVLVAVVVPAASPSTLCATTTTRDCDNYITMGKSPLANALASIADDLPEQIKNLPLFLQDIFLTVLLPLGLTLGALAGILRILSLIGQRLFPPNADELYK